MADVLTNPITVIKVRNRLDAPTTTVGGLCGGNSIARQKINKWSKHKPVAYNGLRPSLPDTWWKGSDGKCGLSVKTYGSVGTVTGVGTFLYQLINKLDKWDYVPPAGNSAQPYRLDDFYQYYHGAIEPVNIPLQDTYYITGGAIQVDFDLAVPVGDPYNLTLADITISGVTLANYYLGAVLYQNNNRYMIGTSSSKMGGTSVSMTFAGLTESHNGIWKLFPFFSSQAFASTGNIPVATFITFPLTQDLRINIKAQGTLYQVYCLGVYTNSGRTNVEYYVHIKNDNSGQVTFPNVRAIFMRAKFGDDPASKGETIKNVSIGSVVVPAKTEKTVGPYYETISQDSSYQYWIAGTADVANIKTTYTPIEDMGPE